MPSGYHQSGAWDGSDLSLKALPKEPKETAAEQAIKTAERLPVRTIEQFNPAAYLIQNLPQTLHLRYEFERVWYRNILFYVGQQWILFDKQKRRWVQQDTKWVPKVQTNLYASNCDAMMSVLSASKPASVFTPASDDPSDIATADVGQPVAEVFLEEMNLAKAREEAIPWIILTGNAFWLPSYDPSGEHGMEFVQDLQCQNCGMQAPPKDFKDDCPQCGAGGGALQGAIGQDGKELGREVPRGKMDLECDGPFSIYTDLRARRIEEVPFIFRPRTYPLSEIQKRWPKYGHAVKQQNTQGETLGQLYEQSLSYLTNSTSQSLHTFGASIRAVSSVPSATVWQVLVNPRPDLPGGCLSYVADGITLEKHDMPYHDTNGKAIWPVIHLGFKKIPGRLWYKSPSDDLIHK